MGSIAQGGLRFLLATLVIFCANNLLTNNQASPGIDYYHYWLAPLIIKDGNSNIYDKNTRLRKAKEFATLFSNQGRSSQLREAAEFRSAELRMSSTPWLYTVMSVFHTDSYVISLSIFRYFSLAIAILAIIFLAKSFGYSLTASLFSAVIYLTFYKAADLDLLMGNVGHLQLGMLVLFVLSLNSKSVVSWIFAGGIIGQAIMFKPNLILVLPFLGVLWLVKKNYQKFMIVVNSALLGALIAFVGSLIYFGQVTVWNDWFLIVSSLFDEYKYINSYANFSWLLIYRNLVGAWIDGFYSYLLVIFSLLISAYFFYLSNLKEERSDYRLENIAIGLGLITFFLTSKVAWFHYAILLMPLFLLLLALILNKKSASLISILSNSDLLIWISAFIMIATFSGFLGYYLAEYAQLAYNFALIMLYFLSLKKVVSE